MFRAKPDVAAVREALAITQTQLTSRINAAATGAGRFSQSNIHEWESGARPVSDRAVRAFAVVIFERWAQDRHVATRAGLSTQKIDQLWSSLLGEPLISLLAEHQDAIQAAQAAQSPTPAQESLIAMAQGLMQAVWMIYESKPPLLP